MSSGIKPPKHLFVNQDADMNQVWTEWKEAFQYYTIATELNKKSEEIQAATLLASLGQAAQRVINNLGVTNEEKKETKIILDKLTAHFAPSRNKTYERCQFHRIKQQQTEGFEDFFQRLQCQVKRCGYRVEDADEFAMDQIVVGVKSEQTRQKLWVEDSLDLEKAKKICRAAERDEKEIHEIQQEITELNTSVTVNKMKNETFHCGRCDKEHGRKQCPAFNIKCKKCGIKGHLAIKCCVNQQKKSKNKKNRSKKVAAVEELETDSDSTEEDESDDDANYEFHASVIRINKLASDDKWIETLQIGDKMVTVNLDTGAECNVMSSEEAKRLKLELKDSKTKRIITYNNSAIPVLGEVKTTCKSSKAAAIVKFKIVKGNLMTILGRDMCEKLGLVIRVQQIQQIGRCNTYEYDIDFIDNPNFKVIPPRRIPHAFKNRVKEELDKMVEMKVIEPIKEPSPAVSPLVIVKKGDNNQNIRICMDPTELNKNIKRCHYALKTVEEIASKVKGSKYFTKLDCNKGFWQIPVTERTSKYLVIATPWGRYRYLRLPFGISSAPEVFSQVMNETLEGIGNCEIAMDDIFIFAETKEELRKITKKVLDRLKKAGFTLNDKKCEFEKERVKFLGHIFTPAGYEADPEKIKAIYKLKKPTNVKELQRLLGMITYLHKFIPNLSDITEPIRVLLQKETSWVWDAEQDEAYTKILKILTSTPVLSYYDVNADVKLSVDASSKALGACLIQKDHPVAYATRALTSAEQNYPQIEKEATAIRFACKKFHEYVYGKKLLIETDHKPLETIFKKPLIQAPARLQRILWDVLQYSPVIVYKKGTQIPIADALSRDCDSSTDTNDQSKEEELEYNVFVVFTMSDLTKQHFVELTNNDVELKLLKSIVMKGWPEDEKKLPKAVRKYHNFKEEITWDEGLLFKGPKVIVPQAEIHEILNWVHKGHPGINQSLARARQSLFWVGQTKDIQEFVKNCPTCQRTQKSKTKEPLLQKVIPDYPFQNVSTDLFHFKGKEYLLIADHYSGFIDFHQLKSSTAAEVVLQMKKWFSTHGIPEILESDGGPQFTSNTFKQFANKWLFNHRISSPYYARSNGFAERNVQTMKNMLKKCWHDNTDIYEALLMLRNTPRSNELGSHSQRLFSRNTRHFIPIEKEQLKPKIINNVTRELARLRFQQKVYSDKISSPFKPLEIGEQVRMQAGQREWKSATVVEKTIYPRSVIVENKSGKRYRRNTIHLERSKALIPDPVQYDTIIEIPDNNNDTNTIISPTEASPGQIDTSPSASPIDNQQSAENKKEKDKSKNSTNVSKNDEPVITRKGRLVKKPKRYQ